MKFNEEVELPRIETYSCHFEPIGNSQWELRIVSEQNLSTVFKLGINDSDLLDRALRSAPAIASDLIELAAAVYAVDRAIQSNSLTHCTFHVTLPVRCPEQLASLDAQNLLSELLHWYTGNEWVFDYKLRQQEPRLSEQKKLFDWDDAADLVDVALWSGGLDAFSGLYNRAFENPNRSFILCGTGSNNIIHKLQENIFANLLPEIKQRTKLAQVTYKLEAISGKLPRGARMRSRGFIFMLIGSMCSFVYGQSTLQIYENGIGAINLRFRDSEIGLNHAHSVHPLSLMMMAKWLSVVLEKDFELRNPFLFFTKAQMCRILVQKNLVARAFQTETCDRKHRSEDAKQCGQCSSCILRRHAFAVLGITDETPYVYESTDWLYKAVPFVEVKAGNHIPAALYQIENLQHHLGQTNPWSSMVSQYSTLAADIVDRVSIYEGLSDAEMRQKLLGLFQQYINEWNELRD